MATETPSAGTAREWVDDRDLEARTPIKRVTWQAWRYAGEGPPFMKVGRRVIYKWADVQRWLESHAPTTPEKAGA